MVVAETSIPSFTEFASEAPMSSSFGRNLVIGLQVAHHPAVDDVAQVTLQDPHGLLLGVAPLTGIVEDLAGARFAPELGHRHAMEHGVHPAVPTAVETMAHRAAVPFPG